MAEEYEDQLARVRLMASGDAQWDLSENDVAAIRAVLERAHDLEQAGREVLRWWGKWPSFVPASEYYGQAEKALQDLAALAAPAPENQL